MRRIRLKHKIKRHKRQKRIKGILYLAGIGIILLTVVVARPKCDLSEYKQITYTAKTGDTLWALAKEYYDGDPRLWVHEVSKLNNNSANIYAGETITILKKENFNYEYTDNNR